MHIQPIGSYEHLTALEPEWRDLYARDEHATPFQSPEWLLPWWPVFGSGELFSFAARDGDRLVAFAPMFLHTWNSRRQVTFLGNGVSDHLGFVLDPSFAAESTRAILSAIAGRRERWDLCDLQDLPHDSTLCSGIAAGGLAYALRPQYTCSSIQLPATAEAFHDALPHGIRRNLRRYRERLDQCGPVAFETARGASAIAASFDSLVELHRARWHSKDDPGMIDSMALERFHKAAAIRLAQRGAARLHTMRLHERVIAAVYTFVDRGRSYSYLGGFDPSLARFSLGALSLEYAIRQSIAEGAVLFDFLRGEEAYKKDWGAKAATSYRLLLWHDKVPVDLLEAA